MVMAMSCSIARITGIANLKSNLIAMKTVIRSSETMIP